MGFPSREDLDDVWEGQKVRKIEELKGIIEGGDNLLDRADANVSIMYEKQI